MKRIVLSLTIFGLIACNSAPVDDKAADAAVATSATPVVESAAPAVSAVPVVASASATPTASASAVPAAPKK